MPGPQGGGRGRGECGRRSAGPEPDGRPAVGHPDSTRSGDRDGHSLLLPGPQPARHVVGHPGRARGGTAQHPHHHRRSTQDGPLPRGDGRLRHRLDRPHQPGLSAEPRARPRQQSDRRADQVGDRRGSEPRRRGAGPRTFPVPLEGGRGRGRRNRRSPRHAREMSARAVHHSRPPMALVAGLAAAAALLSPQQSSRPDYAQQPLVSERLYQRVRFEADGTGRRDLRVRVRVQTEAGVQALGEITYDYNSAEETLLIDSVLVHKAGGTTVAAGPDAVQDVTAPVARLAPVYSDLRNKILTVPSLRPGDTLELHAVWLRRTPLSPGHFWYQEDFTTDGVVLDERLELDVPRGSYVKVKSAPGIESQVSDSGDRRVYRWKHANLEVPSENARRRRAAEDPWIPRVHSVQVSTFRSWEDVGRWYDDLAREREAVGPEIQAKAQDLVRDRRTLRDTLEALYDFVSKDFRYVSLSFGVGRYQPHAAKDVLANQYGDCKDKHTLLASLLAAVHVRAFPALISAEAEIDRDVPSPAQSDHVISVIPAVDDLIWLDATPGVSPFGFLLYGLRNKQALVVSADAAPQLRLTPREPPFPTHLEVDVTGQLTDLGTLKVAVRHIGRGDAEVLLRLGFRAAPAAQWTSFGAALASAEGLYGDVTDVQPGNPTATRQPFEVAFQLVKAGYVTWSGKRARVPAPLPTLDLPRDTSDTAGLHASLPDQDYTARLRLVLPASVTARTPVPVALTRPYG